MTILAWLLTYAIHSTLFLGAAIFLTRVRRFDIAARELVWKTALLGGLVTATIQTGAGASILSWDIGTDPAASAPARTGGAESRTYLLYEPVETAMAATPVTPVSVARPPSKERATREPVWPWVALALWAATALALVGRRAIQRRRFFRALGARDPVDAPRVRAIVAALERRSGMREVKLTASGALSSPVALGPNEICVPRRALTRFDEAELSALVAHKLAHLVRRDPRWLAVVSAIESIFFFQPLNRFAVGELRVATEEACDATAVRWTGEGQALARCLLEVAEWVRGPMPASVPGMADTRSGLEARIRRLVATGAPVERVVSRGRAATAVGVIALAIACGGPSVQSGREAEPRPVVEPEAEEIVAAPRIAERPAVAPRPDVDAETNPRVRTRKRIVVSPGQDIEETIERLEGVLEDIEIDVDFDDERFGFDFRLPDGELMEGLGRFPGFVKVEIEGDAKIEDGAVVSMEPGSRIEIEDDRDDVEKRLVVEPGANGEPVYAYSEDGEQRPFDDEARAWMKEMLGKRVFVGDGDYATFRFDIDDRHVDAVRRHREVLRERLGSVEENRAVLRENIEALEHELQRLRERLRDLDENG